MQIIIYTIRPPQRLRSINWNRHIGYNDNQNLQAHKQNGNSKRNLLPYPVLGAAQAGLGGAVHPVGEAVIVYVLV